MKTRALTLIFTAIVGLAALPVLLTISPPATAEPPRWAYGDGDTKVILFGTIEPVRSDTGWVTDSFAHDIDSATAIFLEVAPEDMTPEIVSETFARYGFLSARNTLERSMPSALFTRVDGALQSAGHDSETYSRWRPWLAGIYARAALLTRLGYSSANGVDAQLIDVATRLGKPVLGLEAFDAQIRVFEGLTLDQELQFVDRMVEDAASLNRRTEAMTSAWLAGDAEAASAAMQASFAATPALRRAVFETRTSRWVPTLAGLLNRPGVYVVAVGLASLTGDGGLIAQLRTFGINAERLDTPLR